MNELLLIRPDGSNRPVDNNYASIKQAMDGATLDVVYLGDGGGCAFFVDDEGMVTEGVFNTVASMMTGLVIFGPVVLVGPTDSEGESTPPDERTRKAATHMADIWQVVCLDAVTKGQRILAIANSEAIPAPQVIGLTEEEFEAWLDGRR